MPTTSMLTPALKRYLIDNQHVSNSITDDSIFSRKAAELLIDGTLSPEKLDELTSKGPNPSDVFGKGGNVRLKAASESYSRTKSTGLHIKSGLPVRDELGREVQTTSELEAAKIGAYLKHRAARDGVSVSLSDHDRALFGETLETDKWCGPIDGEYKTGIDGMRVKALLDDSVSGGQELVPEFYDSAIIQYPLLHSEVLPMVDICTVPKGSSVDGAAIGNPSVSWGTFSGTEMSTFDTSSLVTPIDTSIFPVHCAIEISNDLMRDTPADIGRILLENIGQSMMASLDFVVAMGNGVTQPQGILNASGLNDILSPAGGSGAVPQIDDYESLAWGIAKQYRHRQFRPCYLTNDTSYRRARGIPVGSSDERRVFGMTHSDYQILGFPVLICNDLPNNYAAFGAMSRYRLYRRQVSETKFTSEGRELGLKNQTLLIVRGRYGGRVVDPHGFAFSDNWQA